MVTETRSLHRKLAQVMYEAERIPKNGTAPREMGGYKFVQVGDAADYIRKALAEKVITMMPTGVQVVAQHEGTTKSGASIMTVDLITEWTLTDGESGESIKIMSYGAGADMGDKYSGKASTSAMKYALLTGFLLSTGDDTEAARVPERQSSNAGGLVYPEALPEPPATTDGGLIGTAEIGKARDSDFELRKSGDDDHFALGFKLKSNGGGFKVLTRDELALQLLDVKAEVVGKRVTVFGTVKDESFTPKGSTRAVTYQVIQAERIKTEAGTLPVMPMREDDPEPIPIAEGQLPFEPLDPQERLLVGGA